MKKTVILAVSSLLPMAASADCEMQPAQQFFEQAEASADPQQAIELYRQSIHSCPAYAAYYQLGKALLKQQRYADARSNFTQALAYTEKRSVEESNALARLAQTHWAENNQMQASVYIDKAYAISQEQSPAWIKKLRQHIDLAKAEQTVNAEEINLALAASRNFGVQPRIQLNSITFEFDSTNLTEQGKKQLVELGKALAERLPPNKKALLIGHTDQKGDENYNLKLSERRATAIQQTLYRQHPQLQGLLQTQGKGETELKYQGITDTDNQLNRRVEIELL